MSESRPPFPPFNLETAIQKVRGAEDGWNSCNPEKVSLAYTPDSYWRNRSERSEEHTSELQSHRDLHSFPTRRSSDLRDSKGPRCRRWLEQLQSGKGLAGLYARQLLAKPLG